VNSSDIVLHLIGKHDVNLSYLGAGALKELFENVESRNIVAFVKDTDFYYCV